MSLPPVEIPLGAMRFNSDSQKLEYWNGGAWFQIHTFSPNLDGGVRGLFCRGYKAPSNKDVIDFITIPTQGNATDFGDALSSNRQGGATGSNTRAIMHGRDGNSDVIEFVTFSSTGDATDFGNGTASRSGSPMAVSNGTRGIFAGGYAPAISNGNLIDYVTIATTGNATDFGDLSQVHSEGGRAQSPTRGVVAGGRSPSYTTNIDFFTMATLGNGTSVGDLTVARNEIASDSNSTRGLFAAGATPSNSDVIEFITLASLGNSVDFGNQGTASQSGRGCASSIRFCYNLGSPNGNTIEFVTIATQGDAVDFGDLTEDRQQAASVSNGHGGLG